MGLLRVIYRGLLRFQPRRTREEFGAEMTAVFDEAAADARRRGGWAFCAFAIREITGLLPGASLRWRWSVGGALAGLALGWIVTASVPETYRSSGTIRVVPGLIPERFVPASARLDRERLFATLGQGVLTRQNLTRLISTHDLYPSERRRYPMEEVVEQMRKDIRISPAGPNLLRIAYSYRDPARAQRTVQDLMTRTAEDTIREREMIARATVDFLQSQMERAAEAWAGHSAAVKAASRSDSGFERLELDRDLARRRYESLRTHLAEAQSIEDLERRRQGATLEFVDLASLPDRPLWPHWALLLGCAAGGSLLGAVVGWISRLIRTERVFAPAAAA